MSDEHQSIAVDLSETLGRMSIHQGQSPASAFTPSSQPHSLRSPSPRKPKISGTTPLRQPPTTACDRQGSPLPHISRSTQQYQPQSSKRADSVTRNARSSPSKSSTSASDASSVIEPVSTPSTASAVAQDFFTKELAFHNSQDAQRLESSTAVIIHDACYGHRYSRPRTSKTHLSLIVERPERVQAVIRGISSAYVRLGERYGNGFSTSSSLPATRAIPFSIKTSSRSVSITSPVVTSVHGQKWMEELKTMCEATGSRLASGQKELARVEESSDTTSKPHLHEGDLYLCPESLEAFQGALGGVLDAVDMVFESTTAERLPATKKAFVCVRPPGHHCAADLPSGFCWLNNVHVGIEHAAQAHSLTHAAIIDFDLHHGDGSQSITWQRNSRTWNMAKNVSALKKTAIGYFSLHDINSYPCEDGDMEKVQAASLCIENAHGQTVWNVHLQAWKTEAEFWDIYRTRYLTLLEKTRTFLRTQTQRVRAASGNVQPKAAIFISAGFDASEYEGEGMQRHKVNVPTEFYARFTSDIVKLAEEEGMSTDGRVISVLEGGYSDRALASGALSHLVGLVGPSDAMSKAGNHVRRSSLGTLDNIFPTSWWNTLAMTEIEALVSKAQGQPKRSRLSDVITHASPTESFLAKVVDPSKLSKGPAPPPPVVDWATAAFELSKLLIPVNRQVNSHRPEDLAEPRAKKERLSASVIPTTEQTGDKMQLRGRRTKEPVQSVNNATLPLRSARPSRKSTEPIKAQRNSLPSAIATDAMGAISGFTTPPERSNATTKDMETTTPAAPTPANREGSTDIDQLTASVRRITLRLSDKDKKELQSTGGKAKQPNETRPVVKKAPAPRTTKIATPKTSTPKMTKVAISTPSTPLSNVTSSTAENNVVAGMAAARALSEEAQSQASSASNEILESSQKSAAETNVVDSSVASNTNRPDSMSTFQPVNIDAPLNFAPPIANASGLSSLLIHDIGAQREVKQDINPHPATPSQEEQSTAIIPTQTQNTNTSLFQSNNIESNEHDRSPPHANNSENKMVTTDTSPYTHSHNGHMQHKTPPVFTTHGPIPFGKTPELARSNSTDNGNGQAAEKERKVQDVWDVPDTPQPQR